MGQFGIGQSILRVEDEKLLKGMGNYTDDLNFKNQSYLHIVRSPFASARIKKIDIKQALKSKGVIKFLMYEDLINLNISHMRTGFLLKNKDGSDMKETTRPVLANKIVRFVGDPVLAIIAESYSLAEKAAELVDIEYEEYQSISKIELALENNAHLVREELENNLAFDWEMGNLKETDEALKKSKYNVEIRLINNRVVPNPMECRGAIGIYDLTKDEYTLHCSSQGVHSLKKKISKIINIQESKLNVMTGDVGGGFGMKIFNYPEYIISLVASKIVKRPVKWMASRSESFISDNHGRDHLSFAKIGCDEKFRFTALKVETKANMGAYLSDFAVFIPTYAGTGMLTGCYKIPTAYANVKGVYTNTNPTDAYRGAGRPEAAYLIERLVDKAARKLDISSLKLRQINLIEKSDMPYKTALGHSYDSGDFKKNLEDALKISKFQSFDVRKKKAILNDKIRGLGISTYIEACGGGGAADCSIKIGNNGNIAVKVGTQSNGQGHETSFAQILTEVLGVGIDQIDIIQGNSKEIKKGSGTAGSRSTPVGGSSLFLAAQNLIKNAKKFLAEDLKIDEAKISFENGSFQLNDRTLSLAEVSVSMEKKGKIFETDNSWAPATGKFTYPNGTHICEVEIDKYTGFVKIVSYTVVDDFGKVINPLLLEGQVHGGVVQGIGQALFEETIFDKDSGQLLSGSFMDYAIPRASDIPEIKFKYNEIPCANNILGVKGAGEAGAIGAPPAVINAICDALNIDHIDMPAKSEKIWKILNKK